MDHLGTDGAIVVSGGGQSVGHGRRPLIAATISRFEGGEEKDDEREREREGGNIKCRMDRRV